MPKELDVFGKHQLKIARSTLKMSDVGAMIMGGMTKQEARRFLKGYYQTETAYRTALKALEGDDSQAHDC